MARAIARIERSCESLPLSARKLTLLGVGRTVGDPHLDIAAQKLARIVLDPGAERGRQRADAGDRPNPEDQAAEKARRDRPCRRSARGGRAGPPVAAMCALTRPAAIALSADRPAALIFDDGAVGQPYLAGAALERGLRRE